MTMLAAVHEAGHAVAAHVLGRRLGPVTMDSVTWYGGVQTTGSRAACEREVVILLAGLCAEKRYKNDRGWTNAAAWQFDLDRIAELGGAVAPAEFNGWVRGLRSRAEALVAAEWDAVERLARALLAAGELSGSNARYVLGATTGGRWPRAAAPGRFLAAAYL